MSRERRQIRMDIDDQDHHRLRVAAAERRLTVRAAIREAVRAWLDAAKKAACDQEVSP